ncbi:DUF1772 domain-containing protein [Sphingosinicella sp. LHD-64]|uniref:DUF1772 domain-containing protein n=1 Tax=Sphingosinicella sp. LHD-64 TaxID=3072139 RepID=UPI00280E4C2D|nr:DUF1772 domain-containing protein [Sphingosinicella sp. LHD-64]MDQ8755877.1 DUF1772 domain-containing protein [Sphingosinicella sp. LHD-64]
MFTALLALVTAALFAGGALYVSVAEHPARMRLAEPAALAQWQPSYARAAPLQAGLALLSFLLGAWTWWTLGDPWLLAGALAIGANIPLTLLVIMPANRRLKATDIEAAGPETRVLLARWGSLHALRTLLGLAAVALYFIAFLQP